MDRKVKRIGLDVYESSNLEAYQRLYQALERGLPVGTKLGALELTGKLEAELREKLDYTKMIAAMAAETMGSLKYTFRVRFRGKNAKEFLNGMEIPNTSSNLKSEGMVKEFTKPGEDEPFLRYQARGEKGKIRSRMFLEIEVGDEHGIQVMLNNLNLLNYQVDLSPLHAYEEKESEEGTSPTDLG
jgi:hypothetical protein